MTAPSATVVIPTKNRMDVLRSAIVSAAAQTVPVEILVMDDGSTDGTGAMVRSEFPRVGFHRHEVSQGPAFQRNLGAAKASAPVLVTLDDDCILPSSRTIEQTLAAFDHPRIGAVTIPFINVLKDQRIIGASALAQQRTVTYEYYGGMIAFRRQVYLKAGGCRSFLFMHVEEPDLAIRILNAGYVIRAGTADPIHHMESPVRDRPRLHMLGPRNHVLYTWYNVPWPYFPFHMAATTMRTFFFGCKIQHPLLALWGLIRGYAGCLHEWRERRPVRPDVFRLAREIRRRGTVPLEQVEARLPDPVPLD